MSHLEWDPYIGPQSWDLIVLLIPTVSPVGNREFDDHEGINNLRGPDENRPEFQVGME